jgi:hypothetical protein
MVRIVCPGPHARPCVEMSSKEICNLQDFLAALSLQLSIVSDSIARFESTVFRNLNTCLHVYKV